MLYVLLTAIGVGGATVLGAALGFIFRRAAERYGDLILALASGVMLAASVFSLILPSVEYSTARHGTAGVAVTVFGIFAGAVSLTLLERLLPEENGQLTEKRMPREVLLFVLAIALHNLPEGLAAGVSFGSGNLSDTLMIAGSIALQNIPEGMVLIPPMLGAGVTPRRAFLIALGTGLVEVAGTFLGYIFVTVSISILPFALAFAGGTMLYVIAGDMIPKTHGGAYRGRSTYALLLGFAFMVVFDAVL
ncbi:MAG: ZIP family metal transporter [Clostridia bacterium]|nr:ZIP family metal transporter [Clostridia bacterium]